MGTDKIKIICRCVRRAYLCGMSNHYHFVVYVDESEAKNTRGDFIAISINTNPATLSIFCFCLCMYQYRWHRSVRAVKTFLHIPNKHQTLEIM